MKKADFILPLVSEWPLGPPRYPVKKVTCTVCGENCWLEISPEYLLTMENVRFVCTNCIEKERKR